MTSTPTLVARNAQFAETFALGDIPPLPKMRTVILTCADARVDPAHVLGLELGDAMVIRNTGGRVTPEVIDEITSLIFMVGMMTGDPQSKFELVLMQHTQCGAQRFADPQFQAALKAKTGVDVAPLAIADHDTSLRGDITLLRASANIPDHVILSAYVYDVSNGNLREVEGPAPLSP